MGTPPSLGGVPYLQQSDSVFQQFVGIICRNILCDLRFRLDFDQLITAVLE